MTNMFEDVQVDPVEAVKAKYQDNPDEAWKALAHSQAHIAKLEAEAKERAPTKTVEELLQEFRNTQSQVTPPSSTQTSVNQPSVLDDTTLEQKLDKMLKQRNEQERIAKAKAEVSSTMLRQFGSVDKATQEMNAKAKELGMSVEALDAIALNSPVAFYKLFGIEQSQRQLNIAPTMGNIRTNMTEDRPVDVHAEYREMVSKDRAKYMSEETQKAIMAKAMKAAGL